MRIEYSEILDLENNEWCCPRIIDTLEIDMNHCLEVTKPRTIMLVNNLIIKYLDIKNVLILDSLFKMCVNPIESIIIEIFEYLRERITINEVNHLVGIF